MGMLRMLVYGCTVSAASKIRASEQLQTILALYLKICNTTFNYKTDGELQNINKFAYTYIHLHTYIHYFIEF